jgi:hypothetical protein
MHNILRYSSGQPELADFSQWLGELIVTEDFRSRSGQYIHIYKRLKSERDREARHYLLMQARQLEQAP